MNDWKRRTGAGGRDLQHTKMMSGKAKEVTEIMMGIKEIQEIIPHRHPFLLIDCIEEVTPGEGAVGYKNVTYNEPWFAGHFPQEPVMPAM